MAASLSAYWVKFFKGAGFPLDVATKHAVVFSNNRIKPDMLPELDKPSLKDMGITLMGDMIAILRYAKKVVEETTCERFLVDTEDDKPSANKSTTQLRGVVKKINPKPSTTKTIPPKPKTVQEASAKSSKSMPSSVGKTTVVKKKILPTVRIISQTTKEQELKNPVKRKIETLREFTESQSDDEWSDRTRKRVKLPPANEDKVGYTVVMPKGRTLRSQEILKKISDQKRTVFDRLGDSSVTSTTNPAETVQTFNITGLGSDVLKRNSSVFNRLGNKDAIKIADKSFTGILKNGTTKMEISSVPQGILKNKPSPIGSTTITLKANKINGKSVGTMHADHEKSQKSVSNSVRQLVRTTKKIRLIDGPHGDAKIVKKISVPSSKLGHVVESKYSDNNLERVRRLKKNASERLESVPAKARLGLARSSPTKQVTFDRLAHGFQIKKPGVFSRLGI